jgi:hypothetical protein
VLITEMFLSMESVGRATGGAGVIFVSRFCGPAGFGGLTFLTGPRIEA